jgi:hypothetical protein
MILGKFKKYIEEFPDKTQFKYGISEPFCWRGIYAEVAFELLEQPMTKEEILENIELAYNHTFNGYKGGEYDYNDYTYIHFETDYSSYTDGNYVAKWISKIEEKEMYISQEERAVKLTFN